MKTIQLTSNQNLLEDKFGKYAYCLTSCNQEQKDKLYKALKTNSLKDVYNEFNLENCESILKFGNKKNAKPSSITSHIGYLKGKRIDKDNSPLRHREIHYRDYSKTEEKQKDVLWLINICPDKVTSANSALRLMQEEYLFLWKKRII